MSHGASGSTAPSTTAPPGPTAPPSVSMIETSSPGRPSTCYSVPYCKQNCGGCNQYLRGVTTPKPDCNPSNIIGCANNCTNGVCLPPEQDIARLASCIKLEKEECKDDCKWVSGGNCGLTQAQWGEASSAPAGTAAPPATAAPPHRGAARTAAPPATAASAGTAGAAPSGRLRRGAACDRGAARHAGTAIIAKDRLFTALPLKTMTPIPSLTGYTLYVSPCNYRASSACSAVSMKYSTASPAVNPDLQVKCTICETPTLAPRSTGMPTGASYVNMCKGWDSDKSKSSTFTFYAKPEITSNECAANCHSLKYNTLAPIFEEVEGTCNTAAALLNYNPLPTSARTCQMDPNAEFDTYKNTRLIEDTYYKLETVRPTTIPCDKECINEQLQACAKTSSCLGTAVKSSKNQFVVHTIQNNNIGSSLPPILPSPKVMQSPGSTLYMYNPRKSYTFNLSKNAHSDLDVKFTHGYSHLQYQDALNRVGCPTQTHTAITPIFSTINIQAYDANSNVDRQVCDSAKCFEYGSSSVCGRHDNCKWETNTNTCIGQRPTNAPESAYLYCKPSESDKQLENEGGRCMIPGNNAWTPGACGGAYVDMTDSVDIGAYNNLDLCEKAVYLYNSAASSNNMLYGYLWDQEYPHQCVGLTRPLSSTYVENPDLPRKFTQGTAFFMGKQYAEWNKMSEQQLLVNIGQICFDSQECKSLGAQECKNNTNCMFECLDNNTECSCQSKFEKNCANKASQSECNMNPSDNCRYIDNSAVGEFCGDLGEEDKCNQFSGMCSWQQNTCTTVSKFKSACIYNKPTSVEWNEKLCCGSQGCNTVTRPKSCNTSTLTPSIINSCPTDRHPEALFVAWDLQATQAECFDIDIDRCSKNPVCIWTDGQCQAASTRKKMSPGTSCMGTEEEKTTIDSRAGLTESSCFNQCINQDPKPSCCEFVPSDNPKNNPKCIMYGPGSSAMQRQLQSAAA